MAKLEWHKIPSVREGGKAFFYTAWATLPYKRKIASVAWNRIENMWEVSDGNDKRICFVKTSTAGIDLINKMH
jgi:hypothetical protein